MLGTSKKHTAFYAVTRLLGFFPYSWQVKKCSSSIKEYKELTLKRSLLWSIWSHVITFLTVFVMGVDVFYAIRDPRGHVLGFKTMEITHMIYDVVTATSTALLQIVCLFQSSKVAELLRHCAKQETTAAWKNHFTVFVLSMLVIATPTNCVLLCIHLNDYMETPALLAMLYKVVASIYLVIFIGMIYHNNLEFIGFHIEDVYKPFMELYTELRVRQSGDKFETLNFVCLDPENVEERRRQELAENNTISRTTLLSSRNRVQPNSEPVLNGMKLETDSTDDHINYTKVREDTLHLFDLHRIVNSYTDLPIVIVMFCLIIWLLTSVFYIALWTYLTNEQRCLATLNFVSAVVPVLYLVNSTQGLTNKLKEIKWALTFLLFHKTLPQSGDKLSGLLALLRESPGFGVYGMFSMTRARIVDIFSFVATYMVILLQFNLTENNAELSNTLQTTSSPPVKSG